MLEANWRINPCSGLRPKRQIESIEAKKLPPGQARPPWSTPRRRQSLAHGKAAKRPNRADQMQAGSAQRLHRQKSAQQRAVGDVDSEGAANDVGAPRKSVTMERGGPAGIIARRQRVSHDFGHVGSVAQPHVETLRTNWREHMRGFAYERDARLGKLPRLLDRQWEHIAPRFDLETA